ncbi:hypothetical protein AB4Y45_37555 [Paraburkholderia sp. EG287A]|uniref:hypothetical protein n=1 Tax=unclassified Paraburkholderia TaxID=2615204 RepID=UPI0034D3414E
MIKIWTFLVVVIISGSAWAKNTCSDIHLAQSYPPVSTSNGTICFVRERAVDPKTRTPIDADAISLYWISDGAAPVRSDGRGLLYDDSPGKIIDAFALSVGRDKKEMLFVIHSMKIRESLVEPNSSGIFFSIAVFDLVGSSLRRAERASEWFGVDYSWLSDGKRRIYKFPYQSRSDVMRAMYSPFISLMVRDGNISAQVIKRSYLHESPNIKDRTREYLIEGDQVVVEKTTAGWCKINYYGGKNPLEAWLMCDALGVNKKMN